MEKPDEKNNEYSYPKKWKYWQLKKTIVKTNEQLKKKQMNVNELWTTVNKALQLAKENQQKLVSNEENNETLMNDIKKWNFRRSKRQYNQGI